jgi:hypothetical protein
MRYIAGVSNHLVKKERNPAVRWVFRANQIPTDAAQPVKFVPFFFGGLQTMRYIYGVE